MAVDHIDIYRLARLDPAVPIDDTVGAIADLINAGYVRYIGLSEVGTSTIRRAHAVHPICDLQIEYSLISRGPEQTIFPVLRELGIGLTVYGVLSRGLLSGSQTATPSQLAIAWVLARGNDIIPVIGARKRKRLEESLGALDLTLSPENLKHIAEAMPASEVAGTRYGPHAMSLLNSEK